VIKRLLESIGLLIGRPKTLSPEENQSLRLKGVIEENEIAYEGDDIFFIQNLSTCEMRVLHKSSLPLK